MHLRFLGPTARARKLAEEEQSPYPNRAVRRATAHRAPRAVKIAARREGRPLLSVLKKKEETA